VTVSPASDVVPGQHQSSWLICQQYLLAVFEHSDVTRFARHPTFLYLIYDVLQRRQAALGNSILVKRKDWESARSGISSLTFNRLAAAAKSVLETNTHNDPIILALERQIQTIASQVPQSFARMRANRTHMRALFVDWGMPAFWLTLNPADLRNPLVLKLAGVEISCDDLSREARRIRRCTANMNPVAVAQFFHEICTGVFNALLGADTGRAGILGQVSNYFGVVETNGRGMLHLHCLVWLAGNLEFRYLRERLQNDTIFADKMIRYLKSVIKCSIDLAFENLENLRERLQPHSAKGSETDRAFTYLLHCDSNAVASKRQIHSKNHSQTCFKYCKNGSRECRFLFPRQLVAKAHVDGYGVVQLERNNQWVNPWNPTLSSVLRSNHDISFIPTVTKALAAVYYMTNYATKYDVSQYQLILAAAILKRAIEDARSAAVPSETQLRIRSQDMDKFALRAFNRLACDREISGPQAASCLLGLPDYYTLPTKIRRLNLCRLRYRFEHIVMGRSGAFWAGDEQAKVTSAKKAPPNFFDHYYWRGPSFISFCVYEYFKLVTIKPKTLATSKDISFLPQHPNYENRIQSYSEKTSASSYTVALIGSLSENQALEDSVRGGHPETEAMQNELALILLALLVPWNRLPFLFAKFDCADQTYKQHCAKIWNSVKSSLPYHIQDVAQNIELLRKCKADAKVDAALRNDARRSALSQMIQEDYSDNEDEEDYDDEEEISESTDDFLDLCTLSQAFSIVKNKWANSDLQYASTIPSLFDSYHTHGTVGATVEDLSQHIVVPGQQPASSQTVLGEDDMLGATPDFYSPGEQTLLQWEQKLKKSVSGNLSPDFDMDSDEEDDGDADRLELRSEIADDLNSLIPIIDHEPLETDPTILDRISRVGPNPTGKSLGCLICETLPLNKKQFLIVEKVLNHAIQHCGKPNVDAQDQMLLYVAGEGGTGKTRVIEAIELGYELLQRKDEVFLMAPTGSAADKIRGRTIHSSLCLDMCDRPRPNISGQVYSLWKGKTVMIIDEISMVSSKMLNTINQQCNKIRAVPQESTAILGALPIVLFMGDFHQFPPTKGRPLWQTTDSHSGALGKLIWRRFTNVVILHEQMRQREDLEFQNLVHRARAGMLTATDVATLNKRVIQSLPLGDDLESVCVTRTNQLRHHINRLQIQRFAEIRGQDIYVFPAKHHRTKKRKLGKQKKSDRDLTVDKLLETQDGEGEAKGPGLLLYTQGMPITVLYNICTPLGLVNGAKGTVAGIVPHPDGKFSISLI